MAVGDNTERTVGPASSSRASGSTATLAPLSPRARFVERWEHYTMWPLIVLGGLFLVLYAYPIIWPDLSNTLRLDIDVIMDVLWGLFIIDFVVRFIAVENRWKFVKTHIIDLIALVVPFARPLRALRALGVATLALRKFGAKVRNRVLVHVGTLAVFVWFIAGLAITQAERGAPYANIRGVGDGWWWSFMTMATVGFGDRYPVTAEGRVIGALVVLSGLALLGTLTAAIATWFINTSKREEDVVLERGEQIIFDEIRKLRAEVSSLRKKVDADSSAEVATAPAQASAPAPAAKPKPKTTRGSSRQKQQ